MNTFSNWSSAFDYIYEYNKRNGNQYNDVKKKLTAAVTFSQESFSKTYTTAERTYKFDNTDKYWYPCGGMSLWGYNESEITSYNPSGMIRLDWYVHDWKVEYVKILKEE